MFEITRERTFSAAHQLRHYQGRCERMHGHNWRVLVTVAADELDGQGMVMDFHDLDRLMGEAIDPYDHQHLNEAPPFDTVNPSSENLAQVIGEKVAALLPKGRVRIVRCDVFENDRSCATFHFPK
ncbi:MAG: 6-carboxytetrahydropterin synthase QueD [Deltaproteobacteria bacterium]|nr:6-carboxytetrahydropterin synthase QueD [Deltaproteobacteria bacterium]